MDPSIIIGLIAATATPTVVISHVLSQRRGESEAQAVRSELKLVKQDLSNQIEALDKRLTELKADLQSSDKEQAEQTRREILAEIRVLKAETQNPNNRAKSATEGA